MRVLDVSNRIREANDRLTTVYEEQEDVKAQAVKHESKDEDIPSDLEDEWDELEAERVELEGELKVLRGAVAEWNHLGPLDEETKIEDLNQKQREDVRQQADDQLDELDAEFHVQELKFGQLQKVQDKVMEESFEVDVDSGDVDGVPKQGYYQVAVLEESVTEQPVGAPTDDHGYPSPGDYKPAVGEWLFEKVNAINTVGDTEMGNSSLKEAMNSDA